jgi:hypothetical protein
MKQHVGLANIGQGKCDPSTSITYKKKPPHVDKAHVTTTSQFGQLRHWRKLWMSLKKMHFHYGKQASNGIYQS